MSKMTLTELIEFDELVNEYKGLSSKELQSHQRALAGTPEGPTEKMMAVDYNSLTPEDRMLHASAIRKAATGESPSEVDEWLMEQARLTKKLEKWKTEKDGKEVQLGSIYSVPLHRALLSEIGKPDGEVKFQPERIGPSLADGFKVPVDPDAAIKRMKTVLKPDAFEAWMAGRNMTATIKQKLNTRNEALTAKTNEGSTGAIKTSTGLAIQVDGGSTGTFIVDVQNGVILETCRVTVPETKPSFFTKVKAWFKGLFR